jgi:AhpD family alkylhydroperoxidase
VDIPPGDFLKSRTALNEAVLRHADTVIKRVYAADALAYRPGALPEKVKELLGLVASLTLRCDDCVSWHIHRCSQLGVTTEEVIEALGVGMVVAGTITVPHVRRAVALWEKLQEDSGE